MPHQSLTVARHPGRLDAFPRGLLACPSCHVALAIDEEKSSATCAACSRKFDIVNRILMTQGSAPSYFDKHHSTMQQGNSELEMQRVCYQNQVAWARAVIPEHAVVLDVGCGPQLSYTANPDWLVIGLDPSLDSLRANAQLDLGIFGSAETIPLCTASVDAILCFYSVHHMVGATRQESRTKVARAFLEFGRVLKPDGKLIIFDISPWLPIWWLERAAWNRAKRVLRENLDMYFWHHSAIRKFGAQALPGGEFQSTAFRTSPLTTFPPIFTLPWLRIPKLLYPLTFRGYMWRTPSEGPPRT